MNKQKLNNFLFGVLVWLRWLFKRPQHWFAWVVAVIVTLAMVIICVPGQFVSESDLLKKKPAYSPGGGSMGGPGGGQFSVPDKSPTNVIGVKYGWPFKFYETAYGYGGDFPPHPINWPNAYLQYPSGAVITWSIPVTLSYSGDATRWHPYAAILIAVNLLVSILIILSSARIAEHWVDVRGGVFRLKLSDLVILTTMLSLLLGWRQWNVEQQQIEERLYNSMYYGKGQYADFTPSFIQRLLGTESFTLWDNYATQLSLEYNGKYLHKWTHRNKKEASATDPIPWSLLQNRFCLDSLKITGPLNKKLFKDLYVLSRTNPCEITLELFRDDTSKEELYYFTECLNDLLRIQTLKEIRFPHRDPILIEDIEDLLEIKSLEKVVVSEPLFSINQLDEFYEKNPDSFTVDYRPHWRTSRTDSDRLLTLLIANTFLSRWKESQEFEEYLYGLGHSREYRPYQLVELDLTEIELNDYQLNKLLPAAKEIERLVLNKKNNTHNAIKFIKECKNLDVLNIRDLRLEASDIESLGSDLTLSEFSFFYGSLSSDALPELKGIIKSEFGRNLYIFDANKLLNDQEQIEVLRVLDKDFSIDIYSGLDEDSEELDPLFLPPPPRKPGEFDPFAGF